MERRAHELPPDRFIAMHPEVVVWIAGFSPLRRLDLENIEIPWPQWRA